LASVGDVPSSNSTLPRRNSVRDWSWPLLFVVAGVPHGDREPVILAPASVPDAAPPSGPVFCPIV